MSAVTPNEAGNYPKVQFVARKEWAENLELGRLVVPNGWDKEHWLNYLAARTEYIVRQVAREDSDS